MYGFLGKPRWLLGHLLTLCLLTAFILAGLWQLSRHNERQDLNDAVLERAVEPPLDATELWVAATDEAGTTNTADSTPDVLARLEWRTATVRGRWALDDAVLIRNRSFRGLGGCYLAAPVVLDSTRATTPSTAERAVLVVVGWRPSASCLEVNSATATAVAINLQGRVRLTQTRGLFGPTDPPTGRLTSLARVDVARINAQTPQTLAPVYLELITAAPLLTNPLLTNPLLTNLETLDPPTTDAGPHLGYTVQYFLFAAVALIGYPLILRKQALRNSLT